MRTFVIANLGSNDVAFDVADAGDPIRNFVAPGTRYEEASPEKPARPSLAVGLGLPPKSKCRATTEHLVRRLLTMDAAEVTRRLRFPILRPAFEYLLSTGSEIAGVVLIVTDQSDPVHSDTDTIHMATIAEQWIAPVIGHPELKGAIETHRFKGRVAEVNDAIRYYGRLLRSWADDAAPKQVVAIPTGGIPAMNAGLQDVVLAQFGRDARLMYVAPPRGDSARDGHSGEVVEVDTWPLRIRQLVRACEPLLAQHEYDSVRRLLEEVVTEPELRQDRVAALHCFLEYASRRFAGNYMGATKAAWSAELPHAHRHALGDYWNAVRLDDLLDSAEICCDRRDMYGFVARLGSLRDMVRRHVLRRLFGIGVHGPALTKSHFNDHAWLSDLFPGKKFVVLHGAEYVRIMGADTHAKVEHKDTALAAHAELTATNRFDDIRNDIIHQHPAGRTRSLLGDPVYVEELRTAAGKLVGAARPLGEPIPTGLLSLRDLAPRALARIRALAS